MSAGEAGDCDLRLSLTIPGLPGCVFSTHNSKCRYQVQTEKKRHRTLSANTNLYSALLFETDISRFLKRAAGKELIADGKSSVFVFVC